MKKWQETKNIGKTMRYILKHGRSAIKNASSPEKMPEKPAKMKAQWKRIPMEAHSFDIKIKTIVCAYLSGRA